MPIVPATPEAIAAAAEALRGGEIIAFPTDTVYGLGTNALDADAVAKVFAAKGRPSANPLIVLVPDLDKAGELAEVGAAARELAEAFWPGALTLVLPRRPDYPLAAPVSAGLDTIAVRAPDHKVALALLARSELPIVAPSANRSGRPSPKTAAEVETELGDRPVMILDGGPSPLGREFDHREPRRANAASAAAGRASARSHRGRSRPEICRAVRGQSSHGGAAAMTEAPRAPSPDTLNALARIVGEDHAIRDPDAMAPYLVEWRDLYRGKAALVLKPGTTQDVSAILARANETRTAIVPQGGNTGLVGGQIPFETGQEVVVALERLNHVRGIDLASNTMTVEAGLVLASAQQVADSAGRLLPLSLASEGSCQIGGVLATNAGGMGVLAYGNARELALGLEVVLADGSVWNGLKSLRKDNSGYDLKDLFVGSEGTLGIITAAVLRLYPKPVERLTAMVGLSQLEGAPAFFARALARAGAALTAFELLPRIGVEFVLKHGHGVRDPYPEPHAWYLLFELTSPREGEDLASLAETVLAQGLDAGEIDGAVIAASLAQAQELWRLRHLMSEVQRSEGGSIKHDVAVSVARVPEFITRANQIVELMIPGARPVPFGHLGDGNVHYNVSQPPSMDRAIFLSHWEALNAAVHEIVLDLGGSISAEHGIGRLKRDLLPHAKQAVEIDLMRKIKAAFDPNNILNPGKLL